MGEKRAAKFLRLCNRAIDGSPDVTVARAPFFEIQGVGRLGINGTMEGADKKPVALRANVTPARVVSVALKTDGAPMGLPVIDFNGIDAATYYNDPNSETRDVKELAATLYPEGYAAMSLTNMDGSQQVIRGLMPIEITTFAGICLGVILSKKPQ